MRENTKEELTQFEELLERYKTAFYEINDFETRHLPDLRGGKVVNRKLILSLEQFEESVQVMEQLIIDEYGYEFHREEGGTIVFDWLAVIAFVNRIWSRVNPF